MLQIGKTYKDNNGREIVIAGRIKNYSAFMPFVWALQGDWYDEQTGRFVFYVRNWGGYSMRIQPTGRCITNHGAAQ